MLKRHGDDGTLLAACVAGDAAAGEKLIRRYRRLIYSVPAAHRLPVELFEHVGGVRSAETLPAWRPSRRGANRVITRGREPRQAPRVSSRLPGRDRRGAPGVGKTLLGTYMTSARGRNALVSMHRGPILDQRETHLSMFLGVDKKRGSRQWSDPRSARQPRPALPGNLRTVVPEAGLEPARPCGQGILRLSGKGGGSTIC